MRERIRSFDSKITFFAFADIITAVSGMLVFITLLLATDLGQPSGHRSQAENSQMERQLHQTLSEQAELDAKNQALQGLLAAAETAPVAEKLETDITRLNTQLTQEKQRHASLAEQLAASQTVIEARDRTLGLTDLKAQIQQVVREAESLANQEDKARDEMAGLEQRIAGVQSKLLKLREREGKLWLIPDKSFTTKEPILAVISGSGTKVERFDHPDQTREFSKSSARTEFDAFLGNAKPLDQYVVFMVKPSGIELFGRLVKLARERGFEVGFDALEEDKNDIYFSTPPIIDETIPTQPHVASGEDARSGGYPSPKVGFGKESRSDVPNRGRAQGSDGSSAASNSGNGSAAEPSTRGVGFGATEGRDQGAGTSKNGTAAVSEGKGSSSSASAGPKDNPAKPVAQPRPAAKSKSWWQRFLEWIGLN